MPPRKFRPGALTKSLNGLDKLSSPKKTQTIKAIADDISAALMTIGRHASAGHLSQANTEPIDLLLEIMRDADGIQRALEHKARSLRKQRSVMKEEFRKVMKETEGVAELYRVRISEANEIVKSQRKELREMKRENEMLRLYLRSKKKVLEAESGTVNVDEAETSQEDVEVEDAGDDDAEWEVDVDI